MHCPTLDELPLPPAGKTGWPWTEQSAPVLPQHGGWTGYPAVTVVTPSFNQGRFLEGTIRSILLQGYPSLEYFVLDGGSTDNSIDILKKYSRWLSFWTSEPDGGQSSAINRGLKMGSGMYATWINSDDMLSRNAIIKWAANPRSLKDDALYVGDCDVIDENDGLLFTHRGRVHTIRDLLHVSAVWRSGGCIDQPAVLFPRALALRVGGVNEGNHFTMDYELWGRLLIAGACIKYTQRPFGAFRWHAAQKTQDNLRLTQSLLDAAVTLAMQSALPDDEKQHILSGLASYRSAYPKMLWKQSGRLAKLGLPPSVVTPIRYAKQQFQSTLAKLRAAK